MLTLSKSNGTGGTIKSSPDMFIVEEISKNGTILKVEKEYCGANLGEKESEEGKFARFVLEKRNWNTVEALREIARKFGRGTKSVGYAGMKDRTGRTVQLASIFGIDSHRLQSVHLKDVSINGAWQSDEGLSIGDLIGNHFAITISDPKNAKNAAKTIKELNGRMPNYFDKQRFGFRLNNHKIGLSIMRGDFEGAAMEFVTGTGDEINQDAVEARRRLREERDFRSAISYFPRYLKYERIVVEYLHRYNGNYANALRKLPRGILLMFIHSVEDVIFNYSLEKCIYEGDFESSKIRCGYNFYGFPDIGDIGDYKEGIPLGNLIGYETKQEFVSEYEKEAMEILEINPESFRIKGMEELSTKGTVRPLLINAKDIRLEDPDDSVKVEFSLPCGAYATVLINEITKNEVKSAPELGFPQ